LFTESAANEESKSVDSYSLLTPKIQLLTREPEHQCLSCLILLLAPSGPLLLIYGLRINARNTASRRLYGAPHIRFASGR
jgi:hypothetical protein